MRKDYRPYYIKRLDLKFRKWYVKHFLRPQFQHLGKGCTFMKPWHVQVFGWPIDVGDFATVISTPDRRVRLTVWGREKGDGFISIGKYSLICPGVRISAATGITLGDSCMMASNVYITDSDWHGIYDRADYIGATRFNRHRQQCLAGRQLHCLQRGHHRRQQHHRRRVCGHTGYPCQCHCSGQPGKGNKKT